MEPHDRCEVPGCTLGRAHVGEHVGPPCPNCARPSKFDYRDNSWRCRRDDCGYIGPISARQPMPAASPLASGMRLPNEPSDVDQLMLDIEAEARECDEDARSKQRRAAELRSMLSYLRAWRDSAGLRKWARDDKPQPAPTGASNTGRGSNP